MFDLQTWIGFDKGKGPVTLARFAVYQKLECAEAVVVGGTRELPSRFHNSHAKTVAQGRAWRHLDQLLISALDGALALPQMTDRAMAVANDLHLDMTRLADQPLDINTVAAECRFRLGLTARIGRFQVFSLLDRTHAAATATGHSLDHDRTTLAERSKECLRLVQRGRADRAFDHGDIAALRQSLRRDLIAKQFKRSR